MSAEGVFSRGKGTCEGYHEAYTMLLNKAGIETRRVESRGDTHVWTGVKLEGNWYNVDTTWNDSASSGSYFPDVRHLYFAIPTNVMQAVHKKWGGDYYISPGESMPFDASSYEDNYFVRSGKLSEFVQPYLETSGAYSVSAHLAAREGEFAISAERNWPDNYKEVIYRLVAHELSQRDWGENIQVSIGYSDGALLFHATYDGSTPMRSVSDAVVRGMADKEYSGGPIEQTPQVFLDGVQLSEGTDFQLSYANNIDATRYPNQAVMTITGVGAYGGTLNKVFDINRASLSRASIDPIPTQIYNGAAQMPMLLVKLGDRQLVQDRDFTVQYSDNVEPGTATVTITGIGNYTASITTEFLIEADSGEEEKPKPIDPIPGENSDPEPDGSVDPAPGVDVGDASQGNSSSAITGVWKKTAGKWWFAYDASTQAAQNKSWPVDEWVTIDGKRYHFDSKGYMSTKWLWSGSHWCWLGTDGAMKTGWAKASGKWYFMNGDGIMQTGKQDIGGKTYFLTGSGAMKTGWNSEHDGWYYYTSSGAMAKGWAKVKGKWYYLDPANGLMKTGFYDIDGVRYYSSDSGAMQTGWKKFDSKWYYFAKSGAMRTNAWISGKYWVGEDGAMATDAWVDNERYYVDKNGKWVRGALR